MNTTIKVKCIDQVLTLEHTPVVASGGLSEDFIEFEFCSKWDGFVLTAVFWKNEKDAYHVLLDEANRCQVPPEVTADEGLVYFGVFGVNAEGVQRTSNVLTYHIERGAITTGTKPSEPTPDIYTQIMQEFLRFETEITQQQTAFEGSMSEAWAAFQTQFSQQQTAFEEALTQRQADYEQNMNQQWSDFKTGGDFVLKTDYEQDMPKKSNIGHKHSADDITSGVLPAERGGTGVQSLEELSNLLGLGTVASYLAFVGNANADTVDAALGKNNEDGVTGVGLALAMYAKWKHPELNIATEFPNLVKCAKLGNFSGAAVNEAKNNADILELLQSSTYYTDSYERSMFAKELSYYANIENEFDDLDILLSDNAALNSVLNSVTAIQHMIDNTTRPSVLPMYAMNQSELVQSKFTVYDTVGEQNIVIPADVNSVMVVLIGGGGPRSTSNRRSGGVAGAYRVFAVDTSEQKEFSAVVGDYNATTSFGDLIAEPAKGHDLYGDTNEHYLCGLSGDGVSNDSAKSGTAGWGGGYGGAQGGTYNPGYYGIYGGQGGYGGGDGTASTTAGGTGTKYYGVNGTSGQGCIVIYHKR